MTANDARDAMQEGAILVDVQPKKIMPYRMWKGL